MYTKYTSCTFHFRRSRETRSDEEKEKEFSKESSSQPEHLNNHLPSPVGTDLASGMILITRRLIGRNCCLSSD